MKNKNKLNRARRKVTSAIVQGRFPVDLVIS